jgi:hypothetical protein
MGGRDHSCEGCGRGGLNDPDGDCVCGRDIWRSSMSEPALALSNIAENFIDGFGDTSRNALWQMEELLEQLKAKAQP